MENQNELCVCGKPKARCAIMWTIIVFDEDGKTHRILTYSSEHKARAAYAAIRDDDVNLLPYGVTRMQLESAHFPCVRIGVGI